MADLFEEVNIVATKKFQFETLYVLVGSKKRKEEGHTIANNSLTSSDGFK
jgi:hypothetical protein